MFASLDPCSSSLACHNSLYRFEVGCQQSVELGMYRAWLKIAGVFMNKYKPRYVAGANCNDAVQAQSYCSAHEDKGDGATEGVGRGRGRGMNRARIVYARHKEDLYNSWAQQLACRVRKHIVAHE